MGESQSGELAVLYAGLLFYFRGYHGVVTGSDSQLKHWKMSAEVKVGVFCFLGGCIDSTNILNDETKVTDNPYLLA